jgi:hypothetical protein
MLFMTACSSFGVSRYRAKNYRPNGVEQFALMPLILRLAQAESKSLTWAPGFIAQTTTMNALSPAQYLPAAEEMEVNVLRALQGRRVITPDRVTEVMGSTPAPDLATAIRTVAERTDVDAVILVEVSNFIARAAGLENAQAEGRTDVTCFRRNGEVQWSLSAIVVKGPVGTNAAPSLTQYMEYTMARMLPEIQQMLLPNDGR